MTARLRRSAAALLVAALALAAFLPALRDGFVLYDDDKNVYNNPAVGAGLSPRTVRWALTAVEEGNWIPLARLSHLADVSLFGLAPGGHHLVSLLLHAANAALLLLVLEAYTGALWPAALAAALFGLHPLRAEVAVWVTERKELLAFLLGMLALLAWRRRLRRPGFRGGAAVALLLALGLAAKPVLVTFPFLLLVLDFWPLGRLGRGGATRPGAVALLLAEKVPLFAIVAGGSAVALFAQRSAGATTMLELPFGARLANAFVSVARYLGATLWPARLTVFYPHPGVWPPLAVAGAAALAAALTAGAIVARRRAPWALAGWLWFAGALVPMLGLVQIGWQSMADRYTYLPGVGLCVVAAWGTFALARRLPPLRAALAAVALLALAALGAGSWRQAGVWRDTKTLFEHALRATGGENWLAHQNLGALLVTEGSPDAALVHLEAALRSRPDVADIWYNIGCARLARREWSLALPALEQAIRLDAGNADYFGNLGVALFQLGRYREALAQFRRSLEINPGLTAMRENLALAERILRALAGAQAVTPPR